MPSIVILDESTANQIAAGEVVERPAAVVKELLENSLDAEATIITIEIQAGGLKSISVIDNGFGMDEIDVPLAFQRHATSKIRSAEDLSNISTLGFRGEALPSIATVSKVKLKTRTKGQNYGTYIEIHGGRVISTGPVGMPAGTQITVEELFYNTPARRKHLKTQAVEAGLVADYVSRLAMAYPSVSISLKHNQREVFSSPGSGELLDVISAVYGISLAKEMLPLNFQNELLTINGYVGRPSIQRSTREHITVLINKRYVHSPLVSLAVQEAYHTLLPSGRYPEAVIALTINPEFLDVNIHPAKLKVRLTREKEVALLVKEAVRGALRSSWVIPAIPLPGEPVKKQYGEKPETGQERIDFPSQSRELSGVKEPGGSYNTLLKKPAKFPSLRIIGQLLPVYILACGEDGLYIIDQHAAHERILYDAFLAGLSSKGVPAQMMLLPQPLHLTHREYQVLHEYSAFLNTLGFVLEELSCNTVMLRGLPVNFPAEEGEAYFREVLDYLATPGRTPSRQDLLHYLTATAACRAAIKSGSELSLEAMTALVEQLSSTQSPYTCPHGRPVIIFLPHSELALRFKRGQTG